jgi:prefoldin beta subunit
MEGGEKGAGKERMLEEKEKKFQELQIYEQNLQNIILQRQLFQAELNEISKAIEELEKAKEDFCYEIVGGIMLKREKKTALKELNEKKELLELRIKSFEKQEEALKRKAEELRKELMKE